MILGGNEVYSPYHSRIFTSSDNGATWALSMSGFDQTYGTSDFATDSNGDIYVFGVKYDNGVGGFINKLYKSTNQGSSWVQVSTSGLTNLGNVSSLTISENKMILGGSEVYSPYHGRIFTSELPIPIITHSIHFNANGGSGSMPDQSSSSPTSLDKNNFTRLGYTFTNWNTADNGSGISYNDGEVYSFSNDDTLYAQWSENALGIETQSEEKFLLYPNPVRGDILNLKSEEQILKVLLFNAHGQLVKIENTLSYEMSISLKELTSGLYFINVSMTNGNVWRGKLIKK